MLPNCPILFAEDDKLDQKSMQRAFKDLKITNPLVIVENGKEALDYLKNSGNKSPCLILLDLNMPIMNGIEFLRAAKKDQNLNGIPVVVLTTSKEEQDETESFQLGVTGYMIKPVDYKQFVEVIRTIHLYWTLSITPPPQVDE